MIVDHLGIVVKSIEKGIQQWSSLFGYRQFTRIVENTRQKVRVVFLNKPDSITIKLVEPTDETSTVFQSAQRGGGLHHICFKCDDINSSIQSLTGYAGVRVLSKPQPGEAFNNNDIAFLYAGQGLNIELIDTDEKSSMIPYNDSLTS